MKFLFDNSASTAWNKWGSLFEKSNGTHALLIAGFATPSSFAAKELIPPIVDWMMHVTNRELLIFIGDQKDESNTQIESNRAKTLEFLAVLLGHLDEHHRKNVHIHLVNGLHAKAYAVYEGHPFNAGINGVNCLRLMMGSTNLSYTAFASNLELDIYFQQPYDSAPLEEAARAIKNLLLAIYSGSSSMKLPQIEELDIVDSEIGPIWGVNQDFYYNLTLKMHDVAEKLARGKSQAEDDMMRRASNAALREDE